MITQPPVDRVVGPPPVDAGPLVVRDLKSFDALEAEAARGGVPAVASAHYHALLDGADLVGEGHWKIAGRGARTLSLDPLNLAVSRMTWRGTPAVLDRAATTRLKLETGNDLEFRWSSRGREEPGGLRFELEWPATVLTTLDLDLPRDWILTAPDVLVDGPKPSIFRDCHRWSVACGSQSHLKLLLRGTDRAQSDSVRNNRSVVYLPGSQQTTATFDFELDALRGPVSVWRFKADAGVRIQEATLPPRASWRVEDATCEVIVTLAEPLMMGKASFTAIVPNTPFTSAGLHPIGPLGEDLLEYHILPGVKLESWDAGDYVLVKSLPLPDRGYALQFRGSWRSGETGRKTPVLTFKPVGAELRTKADFDWKIGEAGQRLTANLQIQIASGPVTQFGLRLPSGFAVKSWKLVPEDSGAIVSGSGRNWNLEPTRPWFRGQTLDLKLELRSAAAEYTVPRLMLANGRELDGELTLDITPQMSLLSASGFEPLGPNRWMRKHSGPAADVKLTVVKVPLATPVNTGTSTPQKAWKLEDLTVKAAWTADDQVRATLKGRVTEAGQESLTIKLPLDALLESVRIDDRWCEVINHHSGLKLPIRGPAAFEVHYRIRMPAVLIPSLPDLTPSVNGQIVSAVDWENRGSGFTAFGRRIRWRLLPLLGAAALILPLVVRVMKKPRIPLAGSAIVITLSLSHAQPATVKVFVDGQRVYAPKSLIDSLERAVRGDRPPVLITTAVITGREAADHADVTVRFAAYSESDAETPLRLPVQGLSLESAAIDDGEAFPEAVPGERFQVRVGGKGWHEILLRGRVPVRALGADRQAAIGLDPLPSATLHWVAATQSRDFRVPNRQGKLTKTADGFDADLGSSGPVVVRWQQGRRAEKPLRIRTVTGTAWDLPANVGMVSFALKIDDGTAPELSFELPSGYEPGRLVIRRNDGKPAGIRDSFLKVDSNRTVFTVLPQEPLEGAVQISFRIYPVLPFNNAPALTIVRLLSTAAPSVDYLAVRAWGVLPSSGLVPASLEVFNRELDSGLEATDAVPWQVFRREAAECVLKPVLPKPQLAKPRAEEFLWRFGAKATVEGIVHYPKAAHASAVEFDIPAAVVISDVTASEIVGWQKQGTRIKVWFRGMPQDPVIRWQGTWPTYPGGGGPPFELPMPVKSNATRTVRFLVDDLKLAVLPNRDWPASQSFWPMQSALQATAPTTPLRIRMEK